MAFGNHFIVHHSANFHLAKFSFKYFKNDLMHKTKYFIGNNIFECTNLIFNKLSTRRRYYDKFLFIKKLSYIGKQFSDLFF
ncbi:hypothetical protein BA768_15865 [Chryseobacterium sp. CBo1]|nr:hypothetical protein BA768_15865 [Chryseobacterium sp. CBo1]